MHELSIMSNIFDIVIEHAEKNKATKINAVNLKIGVLSDIIPDWAQMYFDMLTKETIAENAKLNIDRVPASYKCRECDHVTNLEEGEWNFFCEKCESADIELLTGRELSVVSIEID